MRGIATVSRPSVCPSVRLPVCLSVRDVDVPRAYVLGFESNYTNN